MKYIKKKRNGCNKIHEGYEVIYIEDQINGRNCQRWDIMVQMELRFGSSLTGGGIYNHLEI